MLTWQVWSEFTSENWSLDTFIALVAGLMVATARLLYRRFEWLYWTSAMLTVFTAAACIWATQVDLDSDNGAKTLGALGILTVLAWLLVPVLGRTSATAAVERVVGRGPGRVEVELAAGETLIVRRRLRLSGGVPALDPRDDRGESSSRLSGLYREETIHERKGSPHAAGERLVQRVPL